MSENNKKKLVTSLIVVIAVVLVWFLIISPLVQFKKSEKEVLNAGKRYFEVNSTHLPTCNRIKTISLKTLYNKDFIKEDIRVPNSSNLCDESESWIKVQKKNNEYNYTVYLKCGLYSSRVDHKGPTITLKGENEIIVNKGDKFKDPGIVSVSDNTDGKIDVKKVKVDSNVNVNKNGTYEIKYSVKDSFDNKTEVIRTVKVVQILDKMVKNETDKTNYYKGNDNNNYIKLDGILFKIVGLNEDGSVKVTSSEPLAFVDYNSADTWLNDYFYSKLSDNVKKYIKTDSKWCNEEISNTDNYTKCNKYGKKKAIGLLSVADINNSKDKENIPNIEIQNSSILFNFDNSKIYAFDGNKYSKVSTKQNYSIYPTLNIKNNSYISSGNGTITSPYILKGTTKKIKAGNKISGAVTGQYINYSGQLWRVIGTENDGTTKVILNSIVKNDNNTLLTYFSDSSNINLNSSSKDTIIYTLENNVSSYLKTNILVSKKNYVLNYDGKIKYDIDKIKKQDYKSYFSLPSIYDLYSSTVIDDYWYSNYSKNSNIVCFMGYISGLNCKKNDNSIARGIRPVAYINKKVKVKMGTGLESDPYILTS